MSQETVLSNYQGKYQDKYLASTEFGKEASMIIIHHFLSLLSSFPIQASGTIGDYLTGTITLVFGIFFLFLLLSLLTIILTTYARYKVCAFSTSILHHATPISQCPSLLPGPQREPFKLCQPSTKGLQATTSG